MRTRTAALLLITAAALLTACAPPAPGPAPVPNTVVVVYGDSLAVESRNEVTARIKAAHPRTDIVMRVHGGTAQCDWHTHMADDAAKLHPDVVILAFSGNNLTPCTKGRPYPEYYRADANWAATFWAKKNTELLIFGTPAPTGTSSSAVPSIYEEVANRHGLKFRSATPLFSEGGVAAGTLPCLPEERSRTQCVRGRIPVRNPDKVHLCPTNVNAAVLCPTYSSGAHRYATAMAALYDGVVK